MVEGPYSFQKAKKLRKLLKKRPKSNRNHRGDGSGACRKKGQNPVGKYRPIFLH